MDNESTRDGRGSLASDHPLALDAALKAQVEHVQRFAFSDARALELSKVLALANRSLSACAPATLFETEPADLRVLLESTREGDSHD